jgi:hypothetical protein
MPTIATGSGNFSSSAMGLFPRRPDRDYIIHEACMIPATAN